MTSSLITDLPKGIVPSGRRNGASRLIGEIVVDLGLATREDVELAVQQGTRRAGHPDRLRSPHHGETLSAEPLRDALGR